MNNVIKGVVVILLMFAAALIIGWLTGLIEHPGEILKEILYFLWNATFVFCYKLLIASISFIFDYLVIIVGAIIGLLAVVVGITAGMTIIIYGIKANINLLTSLVESQFHDLHARLDRSDRQNLFLMFFLFMLPTLLAVLYLFAESKEFTIRSLIALSIGVFCIAHALVIFDRASIKCMSHIICGICLLAIVASGTFWLRAHAEWSETPYFIYTALTSQPKWESRFTFYMFGFLTLALAIVTPIIAHWADKAPAQKPDNESKAA